MMESHKDIRWVRSLSVAIAIFLPLKIASAQEFSKQEQSEATVEFARTVLSKWVETRQVISKEKRDWALGREVLSERIDLVKREITGLRKRIEEAEKSIVQADSKKVDLLRESAELKLATAGLKQAVGPIEAKIKSLALQLPDPVRERIKPLSQRILPSAQESKASLSERFQNIVGVLNEVDKFNREISVVSEVRSLGDGVSAEVTVLYVGIGQAYYVTARRDAAGLGTASPEGWTWSAANSSAADISKAIAILKNEQVAEFVALPVLIR